MLCGYLATRGKVLLLTAISGLNTFVLYFALPCMLYRFGANTPIRQLLDPAVAGVYLICGLILVAATIALTKRGNIGWNDASFGALVGAFPNTGFKACRCWLRCWASSAGPVILTMAIDMIITTSVCLALSRLDGADAHGAATAVKNALCGMATNPMPWSIAGRGGVGSRLAVARTRGQDDCHARRSRFLPWRCSPSARCWRCLQMNAHEQVPAAQYVPLALAKLLVHPVLIWLACQRYFSRWVFPCRRSR